MTTTVVVATRSSHKLSEILEIIPSVPGLRFIDLEAARIPVSPEEDAIEIHETFEENSLAKARFFRALGGEHVLADDSGLCVDALGGAPGVRSKRYSGRSDLSGADLDRANNDYLIRALAALPAKERSARYVCAISLVSCSPDLKELTCSGTVSGTILTEPRGAAGFGYDPLFFVPDLQRTFAEVDRMAKNSVSHRARALRAIVPHLRRLAATGDSAKR